MKNRYGICVLGILFFICLVIYIFSAIETKRVETEGQEESLTIQENIGESGDSDDLEESVESSITEEAYKYIILVSDGHLVVYYSDNATVFFDSGIQVKSLPKGLVQELETGIRFMDEGELYEFLENYSS